VLGLQAWVTMPSPKHAFFFFFFPSTVIPAIQEAMAGGLKIQANQGKVNQNPVSKMK
jgi:hypothetical protein